MDNSAVQAWLERVEASLDARAQLTDKGFDDRALAIAAHRVAASLEHAGDLDEHTTVFSTRFKLTSTECAVLWHLVAYALSARTRSLMVAATGELGTTVDALRRCVYTEMTLASVVELSADSRLVVERLVEQSSGANGSRVWSVSPRVLAWLLGDTNVCRELCALRPHDETSDHLVADAQLVNDAIDASRTSSIITVVGDKGIGRRTLIGAVAKATGIALLQIDVATLSQNDERFLQELRLIIRECRLLGRALTLINLDAVCHDGRTNRGAALEKHIALLDHCPTFATCSSAKRFVLRTPRPCVVIEMPRPSIHARAMLWARELGQGTHEDAEFLATQYPLAPALIHHAAKAAKARANGRKLEPDDIFAGIRAVLDDKLADYARRVDITQTWDDVVLPDDQMEQINYLVARIRQRRTVYEQWGFAAKVGKGLGTSALFSGPPGTGKTMICALIAKELGLELYQVDMAKITSKYIGETERNLAALFDAAEAGHAILLFDEADSLFGKRTDVKSSNDRYANLETNYLLQRLESFTGICLLTSNHESNIDPAFQRRLSLHLRFELPEAEERAALWRAMLPAAAPVQEGIDFMSLAKRFAMSGGYIRNAALRAAFMAADEASTITSLHLERAAKAEYEGMGKIAA